MSNIVIRTNSRWDGMVKHLGYKSLPVNCTDCLTDIELIRQSQERLRETKIVPDNQLTSRALAHLKLARLITQKCITTDIPQVFAAIIPPASDLARTAGMYESAVNRVYIALDKLEHFRDTIDVLVHELGHHVAFTRTGDPIKMEDLQPEHSNAMTYVASRVFQLTTEKTFDPYLKDVIW